jgi:3-hydroxybutyryl-CoA dehydratase
MDAQFRVGDTFEADFTFTAEEIPRVATLLGDLNPVHHAPAPGYGVLIASGPHIAGVVMGYQAAYFTKYVPSLGRTWGIRFRAPVLADETLHVVWTITALEPHRRGTLVTLEAVGTVVRDGEHVTAITVDGTGVLLHE